MKINDTGLKIISLCLLLLIFHPVQAALKKHNQELFISQDAVLEMKGKGRELVFIDLRPEAEFERCRIPGSINVPLYAVKTKAFLKPSHLILINEGYSYAQLEQECLNLRSAGFKAWILHGGINNWKQKGAQKELSLMTPQALFTEKDYEEWLIIDVSESKDSGIHSLIPEAVWIPFSPKGKEFILRFKKEVEKRNKTTFLSVLILNKEGAQYEKIEENISKTGIGDVFYLNGGLEGYKSFLKNLNTQPQTKHSLTAIGPTSEKTIVKPCSSCR